MKCVLLVTIYIWLFTFAFIAKAQALDTDKLLHPVAHGAGSYALTHIGTVACKKLTGLGRLPCSLIAGTVTTAIGVGIELQQNQSEGNWKKGIAYDVGGVLIGIGVINLDF